MMNKIKLKDIAQICKVSPATVSFVINNKNRKGISASTWNKIEKCLKKHNYLKTKNKNSIKRIIFCLEDYTPLSASRILKGINNDTLFKNEFIFLFNSITNNINNLKKISDKYSPDAIIIATGRTKQLDLKLSNFKNTNIVLLNCWSNNFHGVSILPDEYQSTKKVIKNLIRKNKKKIALIFPETISWQSYQDRFSAWRDSYTENGLKVDSSLICKPILNKKYVSQAEVGYFALNRLIKKNIKFDAVFAMNDLLAMGCYQVAKENNLEIPKSFSIFGFDNSLISLNLKPLLSSITLPIPEMTKKAISYSINGKIYNDNLKIFVECLLVNRKSLF